MDYYGDPGAYPPMYTDPWQVQQGGMGGLPPGWWINELPPQYGGTPVPYGDMAAYLAAILSGGNNGATPWEETIRQSGGEAPQPAPAPNEGQTVETPQGTPPASSPGGTPNYPTDVYGTATLGNDPYAWLGLGAAGVAAGYGLSSIFGGQSPALAPNGPDGQPVFSTTVTEQPGQVPTQPSPIGSPQTTPPPNGGQPEGTDALGNPTWSVTGTAPPTFTGGVSLPPTQPPLAPTPSPIGNLDPAQYPGIFAPTIPSPIGGLDPTQPPPAQQTPQVPGATPQAVAAGGGGVAALPASFPTLPAHAPISPLFQMPALQAMVPGLNQILRGGL